MKCQKCNARLPEESMFCNICGSKIKHIQSEIVITDKIEPSEIAEDSDKEKSKKVNAVRNKNTLNKLVVATLVLLAVIILVAIVYEVVLRPLATYNSALELFDNEKYKEATVIFSELKDYSNSVQMIKECDKGILYIDAIQDIEEEYLESAMLKLEQLGEYKDAKSLLNETGKLLAKQRLAENYSYAKDAYKMGDFVNAKEYFSKVKNYKDSSKYLKFIVILNKYRGTWDDSRFGEEIIIDGWKLTYVHYTAHYSGEMLIDNYTIKLIKNQVTCGNGKVLKIYKNQFNWNGVTFTKKSDSVYVPQLPVKYVPAEPQIGMTAEEVRNSTWGSPEDINTTRTEFGVDEQWCYPSSKYIYLEDGIVTTIQD
ncbi:MAG: zinc ribbon domain-containing protein [Bacillota bacterium]